LKWGSWQQNQLLLQAITLWNNANPNSRFHELRRQLRAVHQRFASRSIVGAMRTEN
jgi:hypothetical protein